MSDDDGSGVSAAPHSFLPYAAVRRKSTCIQEGRTVNDRQCARRTLNLFGQCSSSPCGLLLLCSEAVAAASLLQHHNNSSYMPHTISDCRAWTSDGSTVTLHGYNAFSWDLVIFVHRTGSLQLSILQCCSERWCTALSSDIIVLP